MGLTDRRCCWFVSVTSDRLWDWRCCWFLSVASDRKSGGAVGLSASLVTERQSGGAVGSSVPLVTERRWDWRCCCFVNVTSDRKTVWRCYCSLCCEWVGVWLTVCWGGGYVSLLWECVEGVGGRVCITVMRECVCGVQTFNCVWLYAWCHSVWMGTVVVRSLARAKSANK